MYNSSATGMVVHTTNPGLAIGRQATVTQQGDTITVAQDGTVRAQWSTSEAAISVSRTDVAERYTPGWAIALGILGLLFFLIGIVFFFVKQTRYIPKVTTMVLVGGQPVVTIQADGAVAQHPVPTAA